MDRARSDRRYRGLWVCGLRDADACNIQALSAEQASRVGTAMVRSIGYTVCSQVLPGDPLGEPNRTVETIAPLKLSHKSGPATSAGGA
jgi:hypothetical protein